MSQKARTDPNDTFAQPSLDDLRRALQKMEQAWSQRAGMAKREVDTELAKRHALASGRRLIATLEAVRPVHAEALKEMCALVGRYHLNYGYGLGEMVRTAEPVLSKLNQSISEVLKSLVHANCFARTIPEHELERALHGLNGSLEAAIHDLKIGYVAGQDIRVGPQAHPEVSIGYLSGDTYNVHGQVGSVGPHSRARNMSFEQACSDGEIDLAALAEQLRQVRLAMRAAAEGDLEHDTEIGSVAAAEKAAREGNGAKSREFLKGARSWTLGFADKVAAPIVSSLIKQHIGLP